MNKAPLVAYCCFGEVDGRLLGLSLHSLLDTGDYKGRIVILTDMTFDELRKCCPLAIYPTVTVIQVSAKHELSSKLLRYRLHRYLDISGHAPILYFDCDIIFDKPIRAMLDEVATAEAICFPSEPNSLAMWPSMGGDLLSAEGIVREGHGFNSGTMGIPDGATFRYFAHLESVIWTIVYFWENERAKFSRWIDQPVVNYIQAKSQIFDTTRLTPYHRYCFETDYPDAGSECRAGAVHFFDFDKETRMRDYLGRISNVPLAEHMVGDL
jgi:hypothetical protein